MQIEIPYQRDGQERTERVVARRAPNGRSARLLTIPRSVRGVSVHDLVRFTPSRDGVSARATEVIARSPLLTAHLRGPAALVVELRRRLAPALQHPGTASELEAGHLAVAIAPHLFGGLLEAATATAPGDGRDDRDHRAGPWRWTITSRPTWRVPLELPAVSGDVAGVGDLVAWEPDDPIGRRWDPRFVDELRRRAMVDRDVREALRHRRYLVAVVPVLRDVLARTYGPTRAGARTFPLGAADPTAAHRAWTQARGLDGRVRWAPDRHVDRDLRAMLVALGLDPDVEPGTVHDAGPPAASRELVGGGQA